MFNNLLAELTRKNMTRKELAVEIGIRDNTLRMKLRGESEFTKKEMEKICKRLNVYDVYYLFGFDSPNSKNFS